MPTPAEGSRGRLIALFAVLLLVALCVYQVRRAFLRSFFVDGPGGPAPGLDGKEGPGLPRAPLVRVVLLDGLSRDEAGRLPALSALCREGLDLVVDTGFPTVSLPVQHALWTGLTQEQSGVMYRIRPLSPPLGDSTPGRVPGSTAVAESHQEIIHSFAFARALPPAGPLPPGWREGGFQKAARESLQRDARLAFVHILRIDEAGHRHGAASAEYRAAAAAADRLLGELHEMDRTRRKGTAWFVLSDHGHRPAGGHGDAEDAVRKVRACVTGVGRKGQGELHLVDLSRAIADAAGARLRPLARGRTLAAALLHPAPGATLPRPRAGRWAAAGAILLCFGLLGLRAGRGLPLWFGAAYLLVVMLHGLPTLSNRIVYPPRGQEMIFAGLPALPLLLVALLGRGGGPLSRRLLGQLALPTGIVLCALLLCGGLSRLLGLSRDPPLCPLWSGHASLFLALLSLGVAGAGLAALAAAARAGSDPSRP